MRKATVFLTGGAVILFAAAAVLRFTVVPGLLQLPTDMDTTLRFGGTADLVNPAALQPGGDLASAFRTGVPVTVEQRVRATSTRDQTAVISDQVVVTGPDNTTISTIANTWAVDRKTLDPAPAPSGITVDPHDGLVVGFPLSPQPQHYPYWDAPTQSVATAAYQRTEERAGRETYVYTMYTKGVLKDTKLVAGLPTTLAKSVLLAFASTLAPDVQQGLTAFAAFLPDQLPLTYDAIADSTFWVDTETGYVVDVTRKQVVTASLSLAGNVVPLATVFALDIKFTPETVNTISDDAAEAEAGLTLLGTTGPIVLVVLGVLLLLVAVLLAVLRRIRRPAATAPAAPAAAPPAPAAPDAPPAPAAPAAPTQPTTAVGASDDG